MEQNRMEPFPLGEKIKIQSHIVLNRTSITPREFAELRKNGSYEPGPDTAVCELVAGGETVASGRLVKKSGRWYMQIEETGDA